MAYVSLIVELAFVSRHPLIEGLNSNRRHAFKSRRDALFYRERSIEARLNTGLVSGRIRPGGVRMRSFATSGVNFSNEGALSNSIELSCLGLRIKLRPLL
jgi:hypothetical protein